MFSFVSLLGTSSADLASGSDEVFECADEDDLVTPNGGREHPPWHGKSDCDVLVLRMNDFYSTQV
jgi:hypothetical protein